MRPLRKLLNIASENGISLDWFSMQRAESLSLPLPNGEFGVAIDPNKIRSSADESCKMAHEIGHCMTGSFYNRYSKLDIRAKHERRADKWAIKKLVPRDELRKAVKSGRESRYELAGYFNVTEDFMQKALDYYGSEN